MKRLLRDIAVSETGFLFLPSTGETFTVNELGRVVLNQLKDGKTETAIIDALTTEFDADRVTIERDLRDFLLQLEQFHLLNGQD